MLPPCCINPKPQTPNTEPRTRYIVIVEQHREPSNPSARDNKVDVDQEYVERAKQGDRKAFRVLVDKYQQQVALTVVSMVGPSAEVDDIVQDTFIKCYQSMHRFRGESSFSTYIKRIAINKSLDVLRRRKRFLGRFLSRDDEKKHVVVT